MDDVLKRVVTDLADAAGKTGTRLMLVGAHARDLCLETQDGARTTSDADFAVLMESWSGVDEFFSSCIGSFRGINHDELLMYHRATGLKVDLVPCGAIETPKGTLALRGSTRVLNTAELAECFDLGKPHTTVNGAIVIPSPAGFIVLKLFAFNDRREHRDLRDLGHVLLRFPFDQDAIWDDGDLMAALADGTVTYDDAPYWYAARGITSGFSSETTARVVEGLAKLMREPAQLRALIVDGATGLDPDDRLQKADRMLEVLHRTCLL